MAASNACNTDSLHSDEVEMEKKQQCESPNNSDNDTTLTQNESPESVDKSVGTKLSSRCTKLRRGICTWERSLIAIMFVAILMLAAIVTGLGVYVHHISDRMDKLQCNSVCTLSRNETQIKSGLNDGELSSQISDLNMTIEGFKVSLTALEETHNNDINWVRTSTSSTLTQLNNSLISSLLSVTNEAASNMSKLNQVVQRDISSLRDHTLTLAQNVSLLASQISLLEGRSNELKMNITELKNSITVQFSRLMTNVSSNEWHLRDLSLTQAEHTQTIEQIERNASIFEDRFNQQLINVRENFTFALSVINESLFQIGANHRAQLRNLSAGQDNLNSEVMATKEAFSTNISELGERLTEFGEDLAHTNEHLTNLSSIQEYILLDLADFKATHLSNISSIGQSLVHLNEELAENNESLQNLSSAQNALQRDLSLTNEAFHYNISVLKKRFSREINVTQVQLQNLSSQQSDLQIDLATTRDAFEANISALQENLTLIKGDLGLTKSEIQNLSSRHISLQSDYGTTKHDFYTARAIIERNTSQLYELIHQVERNHSSILGEHSRLLGEASLSRSTLIRKIDETSNSVMTQDQLITGIRSNITTMENGLTGLRDTLTTNIEHLNTRIDDHVDWIQHRFNAQTQRLDGFNSRIYQIELKLPNDATRVTPFGLLFLIIVSLFTCCLTLLQ